MISNWKISVSFKYRVLAGMRGQQRVIWQLIDQSMTICLFIVFSVSGNSHQNFRSNIIVTDFFSHSDISNDFKYLPVCQKLEFQMSKIDHIDLIDLYAETSPDFLIISCKERLIKVAMG